jgi:hypothetical protein
MKEYKSFIGMNLPISTIEKVNNFQERYKVPNRGEAIKQLVDLALFVESKTGLVDSISNEELETIKEQIEKGQIVDYFAHMDKRKFSVLVSILRDEEKARSANNNNKK